MTTPAMDDFEYLAALSWVQQLCTQVDMADQLRRQTWESLTGTVAVPDDLPLDIEFSISVPELDAVESLQRLHDERIIWLAINSLLSSTANLSKVFWGAGRGANQYSNKRQMLKDNLGVASGSLIEHRTVRDDFEHSDERLFKHLENQAASAAAAPGTVRMLARNIIGPASEMVSTPANDYFGWWDPDTDQLTFWGDQVNLSAMTAEVARINRAAEQEQFRVQGGASQSE